MDLNSLKDKVSQKDMDRVNDMKNPPEYEPGFDPGSGSSGSSLDDSLNDLFGDSGSSLDDLFKDDEGGGGGDLFGDNGGGGLFDDNGGGDLFDNSNRGGNNIITNNNPNGLGTLNTTQTQYKPDLLDKAMEVSSDMAVTLWKAIVEMVKGIKYRTADDIGYYGAILFRVGAVMLGIAVLCLIFFMVNHSFLLLKTGLRFLSSALASIAVTIICVASGALVNLFKKEEEAPIESVNDVHDSFKTDDVVDDYESDLDDILGDLFPDDEEEEETDSLDDSFGSEIDSFSSSVEEDNNYSDEPVFAAPVAVDFENELENIGENRVLNRRILVETFLAFFICNTPGFADKREVDQDEQAFQLLETVSIKALANVAKCELEDVKSRLERLYDSQFSYELRVNRMKGIKNTDEIAREVEAYVRKDSKDTSINARVSIEGDFYKIIIIKGTIGIVTFGDIFRHDYVKEFFLNEKNRIPMVCGVTELGEVILQDAKVFDSMMITGKTRSGKSWYVFSVLMSLAAFNTPEDIQFIVVDPKGSNLFNTFSLMPHVAGLHDGTDILDVMDDIIENEAPRRKSLLASMRCEDIWELRDKGIKVPILYLVIDEYISIKNDLGELTKELDNKQQTILTQFPSLGIRLLIVAHRAQGIVDKTNRSMFHFTASVKGDTEAVKETLGINKWDIPLTQPGDVALKMSSEPDAMYVRGISLHIENKGVEELMRSVAKAFYKMGVDMPDMSHMKIACNRDAKKIREELQEDGEREQFSTIVNSPDWQ